MRSLCDFLRTVHIERAGVFPYSPEEGTAAERMERVSTEEAQRRAELLVDVQSRIMDDFNESMLGETVEVLCEGFDGQAMCYTGRSWGGEPGHRRQDLLHRRRRHRPRHLPPGADHRGHGRGAHRRGAGGITRPGTRPMRRKN